MPTTASSTISATGYISYDADGVDGVTPVIFAKIQVNVDLSAENFLII